MGIFEFETNIESIGFGREPTRERCAYAGSGFARAIVFQTDGDLLGGDPLPAFIQEILSQRELPGFTCIECPPALGESCGRLEPIIQARESEKEERSEPLAGQIETLPGIERDRRAVDQDAKAIPIRD